MCKPLLLVLLLAGLGFNQEAMAQKTKKTATEKVIQKEAPPDAEELEDTKIDVAPHAQPFDSSIAPNDDLTAAIKQMLAISDAVNIGLTTADNLIKQQQAANTDKKLDAFFVRFSEELKSKRVKDHFENMFVKVYRRYYTAAEVTQLIAFYKTPIGKKSLQVMPATMEESQMEGGKLGRMLAGEIAAELGLQ